jgi:hypothetical protein
MAAEDAFECRVLPDPEDLRAYLGSHISPGVWPDDDEVDTEVEEGIISAFVQGACDPNSVESCAPWAS